MAQEGFPTAFLQWYRGAGGLGVHIALLHYISSYVERMGRPASTWDDLSFASKVEVTSGAIGCSNCLTSSLYQICASLYVPISEAISAALAVDSEVKILGPLIFEDSVVDYVQVWRTFYLPSPYLVMFLERYLAPVEAWSHL